MIFKKKLKLPQTLHICLVAEKFQILSRSADHSGFVWPIARGLAKAGHKVTVISSKSPIGKSEVQREGVRAFYLNEGISKFSRVPFRKAALMKFEQLHKEDPFHIVHSLDSSGVRIAQKKKDFKVAAAFDVNATQLSQLFAILAMREESLGSLLSTAIAVGYKFLTTYLGHDRQLLLSADGVFVTNPLQRVILERYYLYPDFHIYNVPYGAEIGSLAPKEQSLELRKNLKIPENANIAVTISDMTDLQEMKFILQSFEKVAIKKPNSFLIMIGQGPKWKQIEFEMLKLALGNRVIMTGAIPDHELESYICLGDVFINMNSRTTGFEATTIEAMAQKKIIIGSEVSPLGHVVEDGQDGFLLRPADVESLSELLIQIFSNQVNAEEIGEKARLKVINTFDTQKMLSSVQDAYQQILLNTDLYTR